jgi:hypothetical protein
VALALTVAGGALPPPASAQQAPGGRAGASAGAAVNYSTARLERRLMAVRASGPITLDGLADEAAWNDAPIAPVDVDLRLNVIHRPLSDFFLVYNERRDERTGQMLTRAVIAKMTYGVAF